MRTRRRKQVFIRKNVDYDGYNQAFSEIGTSKQVLMKWLRDGSLHDGDIVMVARPLFEVIPTRVGRYQYALKRVKP